MTTLNKPVTRMLPRPINRSLFVVRIDQAGVVFRQKKCRHALPVVPWERVWLAANLLAAQEHREAKRLIRQNRKLQGKQRI